MNITEETAQKLVKSLYAIVYELERQNDLKKKTILRNAAEEIRPYEPNIALILEELEK